MITIQFISPVYISPHLLFFFIIFLYLFNGRCVPCFPSPLEQEFISFVAAIVLFRNFRRIFVCLFMGIWQNERISIVFSYVKSHALNNVN